MDMDDKELFSSAIADAPTPEAAPETPAEPEQQPQQDDRPRDEHGRFAPKQAEPASQERAGEPPSEPEAAAEQQLARDEGGIPAWRLREMREERNAERQRAFELQRQLEMLQRQMPKPEPKPAPDLYENPDGFFDHRLQQGLSPIEQRLQAQEARMQAQLEFVSRRDAFKEYGEQLVRTSYDWVANGIRSQDPDVVHAYNRAMQSEHPYDAIVQAYKRTSVMQQISQVGDLDKWAIQRAAELAGQQQPAPAGRQQSSQPQGSNIKLPTSLRSVPSARSNAEDDDNDMSDAALFRHATR